MVSMVSNYFVNDERVKINGGAIKDVLDIAFMEDS